MRKSTAAISSLVLGSSLLLAWRVGLPDAVSASPQQTATPSQTSQPDPSSSDSGNPGGGSPKPTDSSTPTNSPSPTETAAPQEVTINSDVIDYKYGQVQVSVTFVGNEITNVAMLIGEASKGRGAAYELLTQATVDYQGTDFGNVTGATYTTDAFKRAVDSALSKR